MWFVDQMVILFLFFFEGPLCTTATAPIYIPSKSSSFSISLSILLIFCLFDNSHPDRCEVIAHFGFNLNFPDDYWCWISFHIPVGHLCVFFGEISVLVFCPFINQVVCFFDVGLYELFIYIYIYFFLVLTVLSVISFANIFSHSVGCLFVLLMVSFAMQKLLS